jgi:hypothetical protein
MSVAPLQFLLVVFAGWVNRRQCDIVAYLEEENRVLREQVGDRRLRFTDAQRRRLAVTGRVLGRRVLEQLAGLVTPDTILRVSVKPAPTTRPPTRAIAPSAPIGESDRMTLKFVRVARRSDAVLSGPAESPSQRR